jgi:hypothetical protein
MIRVLLGVFMRRPHEDTEIQTYIEGRWPHEGRGRNQSDIAEDPMGCHQPPEARKGLSLENAIREHDLLAP